MVKIRQLNGGEKSSNLEADHSWEPSNKDIALKLLSH